MAFFIKIDPTTIQMSGKVAEIIFTCSCEVEAVATEESLCWWQCGCR
jgi:hypothetical protein